MKIKPREMAVQIAYQMDIRSESDYQIIFESYDDKVGKKYYDQLFTLFAQNKENIDSKIKDNLRGWTIDRIGRIDLAVLRVLITDLFYIKEEPEAAVISEYLNIAKKYGDEKCSKFVHGLIGKLTKSAVNVQPPKDESEEAQGPGPKECGTKGPGAKGPSTKECGAKGPSPKGPGTKEDESGAE